MNVLQVTANAALERMNAQIRDHYSANGGMPDYQGAELEATVAEDESTVVLFCSFPDGFIATVALVNIQAQAALTKAMS